MDDYSGSALLKFLDYEADKGLVKKATIASRKASVNSVFGILSPNEVSDLRSLDIDSVMSRFANKRGTDFTPDSLVVYKSRLSSAIRDFIEYGKNPAGFKTGTMARSSKVQRPEAPDINTKTNKTDNINRTVDDDVAFPIPVRPGVVVRLVGIPSDLTKREASKIANIVMALAQTTDD